IDVDAVAPIWGYGLRHRSWVEFWYVVCTIFGPNGFRVIGLAAIAFATAQRNLRLVLFLLMCIGLTGVVAGTAKGLADRPRPTAAMVYATSSAFPSGHAVAAMAGVLALLTVTRGLLGRARPWAIGAGALIVIAVGFGRVALAVHYPSDVLAGW